MPSRVALPFLAAFVALALAGDAFAQRRGRAKPACGLSHLPFVEGAVWTYKYAAPENPPELKGLRLQDPESFTIRVVQVKTKGRKSAEITLEESFRKVKRETKLRCGKDGLEVDPQSFFFAAEIGGALGAELENLERLDGVTWPAAKGFRTGSRWREEIVAEVVRAPSEGTDVEHEPGRIEVEREAIVGQKEFVTSNLSDYENAVRVEVNFTGRAFVRVREKPVAMPSARAVMWLVPGVGIVRAENRLAQGWSLAEYTLPGEDAE